MYNICMKPRTLNVSESMYALFQAEAKRRDRTASELIREAMEFYMVERLKNAPNLDTWKSISLGGVKRDWADGAFRGDMIDERDEP
jgi:hypothetical protein